MTFFVILSKYGIDFEYHYRFSKVYAMAALHHDKNMRFTLVNLDFF